MSPVLILDRLTARLMAGDGWCILIVFAMHGSESPPIMGSRLCRCITIRAAPRTRERVGEHPPGLVRVPCCLAILPNPGPAGGGHALQSAHGWTPRAASDVIRNMKKTGARTPCLARSSIGGMRGEGARAPPIWSLGNYGTDRNSGPDRMSLTAERIPTHIIPGAIIIYLGRYSLIVGKNIRIRCAIPELVHSFALWSVADSIK